MPTPSVFSVGRKPAYLNIDDDEIITLYPRGGTLYYGDRDVSPQSFTGAVTPGSSVELSSDVWLVATDQITVFSTTAPVTSGLPSGGRPTLRGAGDPVTLAEGQLYLGFNGDPNDAESAVEAVWQGLDAGPDRVLDARPEVMSGVGASRPLEADVPLDALFMVTDNATIPKGLYQNQGGTWTALDLAVAADVVKTKEWRITGASGAGSDLAEDDTDWAWSAPAAGTIVQFSAYAQSVAPSGQDLIVDVKKNGSTVFPTTPAPTVPRDLLTGTAVVPDTTDFVAGDRIQPIITQVGVEPGGLPVFKGQDATAGSTTGGTTISVARHQLAAVDDFQVVGIFTNPRTATWTPAGGAGWQSLGSAFVNGTNAQYHWFARLDDGATGPWTFTCSATIVFASQIYELFENVDLAATIDAGATGTGLFQYNSSLDTNIGPGTLTTSVPDVLELLWERTDTTVTVNPGPVDAGYTVINGFSSSVATTNHIAYIARPAAGSQAAPTCTTNSATTSAIARIPIVGSGTPPTWSPGEDVTVVMRYQES